LLTSVSYVAKIVIVLRLWWSKRLDVASKITIADRFQKNTKYIVQRFVKDKISIKGLYAFTFTITWCTSKFTFFFFVHPFKYSIFCKL